MDKICLVTGGAGFIGSSICRGALAHGMQVRVLDNLVTGKKTNLDEIVKDVEFIEGDIRDEDTLNRAMKGVSWVLHLGALPSVSRSVQDPTGSDETNIRGTLNVLLAARDSGVQRLVFSSSSSVYGDTKVLPKREDMCPCPLSPYALHKLTGEHYCRIFFELFGLETISLRYFNVYGPRQNPKSQYAAVIPLFINHILNDESPKIDGDGKQTRDFTFVEDVVRANLAALEAPAEATGKVFNAARGDRTSVIDIAYMIGQVCNKEVIPIHGPARPGDVRDSQADASQAERMLGWKGLVSLEEGLKKTCEYYANLRQLG